MPGKRWATADRLQFLDERLQAYAEAQEAKETYQYKQKLSEEYFEKFPEPDEKRMALERQVSTSQY